MYVCVKGGGAETRNNIVPEGGQMNVVIMQLNQFLLMTAYLIPPLFTILY